MIFIGKQNKNSKKGHRYVQSFIAKCWQEGANSYVNLDYDTFSRNKKFKYLLLREQGFRCSYCMRHLKGENTTIEHVIPKSTDTVGKMENYFKHDYGSLNPDMIFLGNTIDKTKKLQTPPYPHFLAYENLVASCDGKINRDTPQGSFCCNHCRKSKEIIPIFFLQDAASIIIYENDGNLTYDNKYNDTIQAIKLNHPTLKLIRKGWAQLPLEYALCNIKAAITDDDLRKDIVDDMELDIQTEEPTLKKKAYWKLFWEYRWFYSYFRSTH